MNYSVNKFFNDVECREIIDFCMEKGEKFSYHELESSTWDCRRVYDEDFKKMIIEKINTLYSNNQIDFWFNYGDFNLKNFNISLTRYYDGRHLNLHLDKTSNYTTVISLTENYENGDFCLSKYGTDIDKSDIKIHLNIGEGVTFEGNKTYHGVMPVTKGIRCALNIWMNDTDFAFYKLDKKKKLI